jgi:hypothetical protein
MSSGSALNPYGAVVLWDGECPRTFTAKAREVISGGWLVQVSGAAGVVSSGADSYACTDIIVVPNEDVHLCNGISLHNAGSNANVTVATRGAFIVESAGVVSGGMAVVPIGTPNAVVGTAFGSTGSIFPIGRAITAAGSEAYFILNLCC